MVDDVVMGCVMQVGEQAANVARNAVLAAGLARARAGHHHRPPVRIEPAGGALRRAGRDRRRLRRRRRRRRRGDDPGADGRRRWPTASSASRSARRSGAATRRAGRARAAGHLRRADRRQVGHQPRRHGRVRRAQPATRRAGDRRGPLRARDPRRCSTPTGNTDDRRRGAARHDDRVARQAQAGVPLRGGGRPGDRRQLVADHRRRGGDPDHERGARRGSSA